MSGNITEVRLLAVPLENDYIHTFYFSTAAAQSAYFAGKTVKLYTDFSYQRKDNVIRIPDHYDSLLNCNYVMYKNTAYSSKWFYAFITDIEYINDGLTNIRIETDVIQTWLFDYTVKPSFIEREHVEVDAFGLHTVPEQLEHGEYICNNHTKAGYCTEQDLMIIVGATKSPDGENVRGTLYNNIYSGLHYYAFSNTFTGATALQQWLDSYADDGASDAITCMFLVPKRLISESEDGQYSIVQSNLIDTQYINGDSNLSINTNVNISDGTLNGYEPTNKKLLSFPYRYLLVSNNTGGAATYQYEHFTITENGATSRIKPKFKIEGCLTVGGSVRMIPLNYKGAARNDEEGINLGKFPTLNWTTDVYTNWLTQNAVNIGISAANGIGQIVAGAALTMTGAGALAGVGAIATGLSSIAGTMGEVYSHSLQPPQSEGNINSGDIITASGNNDFHFYDMTIKTEYAVMLDGYFNMFGYKVNRVKTPAVAHRENYWYTKTVDVNIDGAIPMRDLQKIKECYNRGITFWRNPANIGNYSVSNLTQS